MSQKYNTSYSKEDLIRDEPKFQTQAEIINSNCNSFLASQSRDQSSFENLNMFMKLSFSQNELLENKEPSKQSQEFNQSDMNFNVSELKITQNWSVRQDNHPKPQKIESVKQISSGNNSLMMQSGKDQEKQNLKEMTQLNQSPQKSDNSSKILQQSSIKTQNSNHLKPNRQPEQIESIVIIDNRRIRQQKNQNEESLLHDYKEQQKEQQKFNKIIENSFENQTTKDEESKELLKQDINEGEIHSKFFQNENCCGQIGFKLSLNYIKFCQRNDLNKSLQYVRKLAYIGQKYSQMFDHQKSIQHFLKAKTILEKYYPHKELEILWLTNRLSESDEWINKFSNANKSIELSQIQKKQIKQDQLSQKNLIQEVQQKPKVKGPQHWGILRKAIEIYKKEFEVQKQLNGSQYCKQCFDCMKNISSILFCLYRLEQCAQNQQNCLIIARKIFEPKDIKLAIILRHLSYLYQRQENEIKSYQYMKEAQQIYSKSEQSQYYNEYYCLVAANCNTFENLQQGFETAFDYFTRSKIVIKNRQLEDSKNQIIEATQILQKQIKSIQDQLFKVKVLNYKNRKNPVQNSQTK